MPAFFDTIIAPITASGGAVSLIRISGPQAWSIGQNLIASRRPPNPPTSHQLIRVRFINGDDGLLCRFEEGRSYTGEESLELHLHGSRVSVDSLIQQGLILGLRMARPGEFTERAFLNGNLDLSQAEAVNETVLASTDRQLKLANLGRLGGLKKEIESAEEHLVAMLAAIEASVDFSEEIGEVDMDLLRTRLQNAIETMKVLHHRSVEGQLVREGLRIAIMGPPNAGKSSLLNRLLGVERSIVTEIPGTTRDYIEETCELAGIPCVLIDTAGLRQSDDPVESIGIQRSYAVAAKADLIWFLYDRTQTLTDLDREIIAQFGDLVWVIGNKSELIFDEQVDELQGVLKISTYTGEGFHQLIEKIRDRVPEIQDAVPNRRHQQNIEIVLDALAQMEAGIESNHPPDLLVTHLRQALHQLGEISGKTASSDLLERIFRDFCIGK